MSYKFVRPQDPSIELSVFDAARATSATSPYFKPFLQLNTWTRYTDGEFPYIFPVAVADSERKLLWEDVKDRLPDILLSLGTGLDKTSQDNPSFATSSSSPEQATRDEDKRRYMRIDLQFPKQLPDMDGLDHVDYMETFVSTEVNHDPKIREVAHMLVASCFYFEISGLTTPCIRNGKCVWTGKRNLPQILVLRYERIFLRANCEQGVFFAVLRKAVAISKASARFCASATMTTDLHHYSSCRKAMTRLSRRKPRSSYQRKRSKICMKQAYSIFQLTLRSAGKVSPAWHASPFAFSQNRTTEATFQEHLRIPSNRVTQ